MDHLRIPVDMNIDANWRERCQERMERLRNLQPGEELSGVREFLISPELYQSVESKVPDRFIDELEKLMSSERNLSLSIIFDQVTVARNSLLHLAAHFGAQEIAELIAYHFPELLTKRNIKGDTPLHVAARAKSSNVIKLILSHYAVEESKSLELNDENEELTRLKNECGNTALHEAVYANHYKSVSHLFLADKSAAHLLNKSDESPLYIAVLHSNNIILNLLLEATSEMPSSMSYGISPLHAVIFKKDSALLNKILVEIPKLMFLRDEDGGTPLHHVASIGYLDGVHVLLNKFTLLAQERDAKGNLPIHLACKMGHVNVVKEFIKKGWPNIKDSLNPEGQNILHIAANNRKDNMVKYLLRDAGLQSDTINEKDNHGNTALHLASNNCYPEVLFHLTQDKRVNVNMMNNDNFTAYDLLLKSSTMHAFCEMGLAHGILYQNDARPSGKTKCQQRDQGKVSHKIEINKVEKSLEDYMKAGANTIILISILIATVTFAAGFTVPGNVYGSDENDPQKRGLAVLANKALFQMFMICNTIAMYSSISGCIILMSACFDDFYGASISCVYGLYMVGVALMTMSLAFLAAIRLVLCNVTWLANLVTIIATICFSLNLVTFILVAFPLASRKPGLRQMCNVLMRLLLWFRKISRDPTTYL